MLRLNSRLLGKQATSPTPYICQRCVQTARLISSPSNYLWRSRCSRDYHTTAASLQRYQQWQKSDRPKRRYPRNDDDDTEPFHSSKQYGRVRRYRNVDQDYPDERDDAQFDEKRYQRRGGGSGGRDVAESSPDLQAIMANARDSDFSKRLHKLKREELERRDPAQVVLKGLEKPSTFQDSSLRPIVKKALLKAYPNMTVMSTTQKNLLVLLQEGYSVCATGPPGSGKSFLVALWLLQLLRSTATVTLPDGNIRKTPITTGIIFVPTVDLLNQYLQLLETLLGAFAEPGQPLPPKETIFQGFTRLSKGLSDQETAQFDTLAKYPNPHIIITTPTRFLDILNDPDARNNVDLGNLKVVVADEVDSMLTQRPAPKRLTDMRTQKRIRKEIRWARPTPLETGIDFIIGQREMINAQRVSLPEQIQLCCISPNLSPVLKSKIIYQKRWLGLKDNDSKANSLVNLGIQDFSKMFEHEKMGPIVNLPSRIKHYALSVDITTGMMRDIPSYNKDALIRSEDERNEIEKYVGILRTHHDPRLNTMSKEALTVEAAQEAILNDEEGSMGKYTYIVGPETLEASGGFEVKDIITDISNDFRHTSIPRRIVVEILDVLLKRDNYPDRVIMFVTPNASRVQYLDTLKEAGFNAEQIRLDTCQAHGITIGRSDLPPPKYEKKIRTKADTTIWVASSVSSRGLDTPHFTHAYIMVPTTGYQKYAQMAGRIARYPFDRQMGNMPEPKGQVTTVYMEEPVGEHEYAPMVDGVIQIDSPVEGLAWRRIHRMYGLCGAKVEKYFGPGEENGVMLKTVETHAARFPEMDEELPWEDGVDLETTVPISTGLGNEDSSYEFLPLEGQTIEIPKSISSMVHTKPEGTEVKRREEEDDTHDSYEEDENDPKDSPSIYQQVELQDGPHFTPENAPDAAAPIESIEPDIPPTEPEKLVNIPLEIAEGITEEEVKEFQASQDEIFAAFLELNAIQDKLREAREKKEGKLMSENPEEQEEQAFERHEIGEVADCDIDGVQVRSVPAKAKDHEEKS
ncbi:hypothetical protein ABW20_dc0102994 [Dactylellina cionopaga]|nr:hypothetical protein ABW20_dc0102994 [Dactylellina cionopaga]